MQCDDDRLQAADGLSPLYDVLCCVCDCAEWLSLDGLDVGSVFWAEGSVVLECGEVGVESVEVVVEESGEWAGR